MPELAPHTVAPEPSEDEQEVLSPELVLVDPLLRDRLASLPLFEHRAVPAPVTAPTEEAPGEPQLRVARGAEPALPQVDEPAAPLPPPPPPKPEIAYYTVEERPRRRRRWPLVVAVLAGAGVAAGAGVLLERTTDSQKSAGVVDPAHSGRIAQPASSIAGTTVAAAPPAPTTTAAHTPPHHPRTAPHATPPRTTPKTTTTAPVTSSAPGTRPKPTTKPKPKAKPKPTSPVTTTTKPAAPPPAATHEKLAWAPTAGATAYELELLRNSTPVLHTRTKLTSMIIAVRTGANGPAGSLAPGRYEWIVWPIVRGKRAQPTVRSQLTLRG